LSEPLAQTRVEARNDRSHLRSYARLLRELLKQRHGAFVAYYGQSLSFGASQGTSGGALHAIGEGGTD
jgi:hypothetical protein